MKKSTITRLLASVLTISLCTPMSVWGTNTENLKVQEEQKTQEKAPNGEIEIPKIETSEVQVPEVQVPEAEVQAPEVQAPEVQAPEIQEAPEVQALAPEAEVQKAELLTETAEKEIAAFTQGGSWSSSGDKWWYRNADGSYPRSCWQLIDAHWYYFDADGWMLTSWIQLGNTWYYLEPWGAMAANCWIGNYYVKADGAMAVNQWIGKYYVNETGLWISGVEGWDYQGNRWKYHNTDGNEVKNAWKLVKDTWYYFDGEGWMQTGWLKLGSTYYYLQETGAMEANCWIGNYYVGASGAMAVKQWIGKYYVGENGAWIPNYEEWVAQGGGWWYHQADGSYPKSEWKLIGDAWFHFDAAGWMQTGWLKLKNTWYYLQPWGAMAANQWVGNYYVQGNGDMAVDQTLTLEGTSYLFNSSGIGYLLSDDQKYVEIKDSNGKEYLVEKQYATDPQVSDDDFWAAVLYAESGDQSVKGMTAVAMTIWNRMESSQFPDDLRTNIYKAQQFDVARNGTMTKYLKDINAIYKLADVRKAAADAKAIHDTYKNGGKRVIAGVTMPNGKTDFDYLFFMTPAAFSRLNLDEEKCDVMYLPRPSDGDKAKGHIFFKNWVRS